MHIAQGSKRYEMKNEGHKVHGRDGECRCMWMHKGVMLCMCARAGCTCRTLGMKMHVGALRQGTSKRKAWIVLEEAEPQDVQEEPPPSIKEKESDKALDWQPIIAIEICCAVERLQMGNSGGR